MNNFIFSYPTKTYFGKGCVREYLASELSRYGGTVMLAYGGGSVKRSGVYDEIMAILKDAGKQVVEFPGIMSNPTYTKVQEGAALARETQADFILAVGGGSVHPSERGTAGEQRALAAVYSGGEMNRPGGLRHCPQAPRFCI